MFQTKSSRFQKGLLRLLSTEPGRWFMSHTQHHSDQLVMRLSGGKATLASLLTGLKVISVTTIGAKSGQRRTVPLLPIPIAGEPNSFTLMGTNWGGQSSPSWYYNMKANPEVTVTVDGKAHPYLARELDGEAYEASWQSATKVYPGYPKYRVRASHRHIPVMRLDPAA